MNINGILGNRVAIHCRTKKEFDLVVGLFEVENYMVSREVIRNKVEFKECYLINSTGHISMVMSRLLLRLCRFKIITSGKFLNDVKAIGRFSAALWGEINAQKEGSIFDFVILTPGLDEFWGNIFDGSFKALNKEDNTVSIKDGVFW